MGLIKQAQQCLIHDRLDMFMASPVLGQEVPPSTCRVIPAVSSMVPTAPSF